MAVPAQQEKFPQQVSHEQSSESKTAIVFSNGSIFPHDRQSARARASTEYHVPNNTPNISNGVSSPAPRRSQARDIMIEGTPRPTRYPEFTEESRRLNSFTLWVHGSPTPASLSRAGFFYTGQLDLVRCYWCGIGLKDFAADDDPLVEHVRYSAPCPHLMDLLGPSALADLKRQFGSRDETGFRGHIGTGTVSHPRYSSLESRVASFVNWPHTLTQTPAQLAEAGLFYTGTEDHVRCFTCNGGLRRWDADDDPWTEHCRWFPTCPYAIEMKGIEYIALVQASTEHMAAERDVPAPTVPRNSVVRDPVLQTLLDDCRTRCREMGYTQLDIEAGIEEILNRGDGKPSLAEIIDTIEIARERRQESAAVANQRENETPLQENRRLKSTLTCMNCGKRTVNTLLLPCTHHRLCTECAEPLTVCPQCQRPIVKKIRTFLV